MYCSSKLNRYNNTEAGNTMNTKRQYYYKVKKRKKHKLLLIKVYCATERLEVQAIGDFNANQSFGNATIILLLRERHQKMLHHNLDCTKS